MKSLFVSICASVLTIAATATPAVAQNPADNQAAESTINNCLIQSVAAFPNRVHILCLGPIGGVMGGSPGGLSSGAVRYFAVENAVSGNAMAVTVLSVANAAIQRNRSLTIIYRTNPNENPPGCNAGDCRRIVGVMMN